MSSPSTTVRQRPNKVLELTATRGGTWRIFMFLLLFSRVLPSVAAAQLGRSAGSSTPVHTLHENRIGVSYSESVLVIVTTVEQGLYPVAPRRLSMP